MSNATRDNLRFFKTSQANPEPSLDNFYIFDELHPDLQKYIRRTKQIKELLITIRTLRDKKEAEKVIDKYFCELQQALSEFSNASEFMAFVNACDNSVYTVKGDLSLLKIITDKYFVKRSLTELVPEEWVQAILDSNASRKKGSSADRKLIPILTRLGFNEEKNLDDLMGRQWGVIKFPKVKNARARLGVKVGTKTQGKKLDLIIKSPERVFLLEAKHINTSGGGQNKQISELIEILSLKEKNPCISYIAFLDGRYSNEVLSGNSAGEKLKNQRKEIKKYLKRIPTNYWLNTAGFRALFEGLSRGNKAPTTIQRRLNL